MKWFKHDTDASIDAKLQELMLDYGASGYGLYWYCVELIAQNVNENNITFELEHDSRIIARNLNLTVKETQDMMKKMIELDLFSISTNNKLACYTLAKRIDQSMTSSPHFRELIKSFKENHDAVMIKSCVGHDKVMQDKIREEKNNAVNQEDLTAFETIWKEYTLGYLKKQGRRGGSKSKAKEKFKKLMKKYTLLDIKDLVISEYKLKLGSRDLERVFALESMKDFMEDIK